MTRRSLILISGLLFGLALGLAVLEGFPNSEATTLQAGAGSTTSDPALEPQLPDVGPQLGAVAPDFMLQDLTGQEVRLSDQRGKVVLLNFWATWCGPCRVEMPVIQDRYDRLREDDFTVLAVNFAESKPAVTAFRQSLGLSFPILLDSGGEIQALYQVRGYPTSILVDTEGIIETIHIGPITEGQLDQYLREVGIPE